MASFTMLCPAGTAAAAAFGCTGLRRRRVPLELGHLAFQPDRHHPPNEDWCLSGLRDVAEDSRRCSTIMRREEKAECEKMHTIMDTYKLDGQMRWLVAQKNRMFNGELYRYIADGRGVHAAAVSSFICNFFAVLL